MKFWFCCIFVFFLGVYSEKERILYNRNGDLSIIGIFDGFSGDECTTEVGRGLEEAASAIWTVETLNNLHYLPNITLGLSIFDGCRYLKKERKKLSRAGLEDNKNIGILTSREIYNKMENFSNTTMAELNHVIKSDLLVELTLQLLLNLQWTTLRAVVSDSGDILDLFTDKVAEEKITVQDYVLITERDFNLTSAGKTESTSVTVVIADSANISSTKEKLLHKNSRLIITPTDYTFDMKGFPTGTIVLLPSMEGKGVLSKYIKNTARYKNFFSHKGPTKSPLFMGTAASILKLLKPTKNLLEEHCKDVHLQHPCAEAVDFMGKLAGNKTSFAASKWTEISPDDILETLNVLKIKPSLNDEMFLYIATVLNVSEDLSIFKIFNMQTKNFEPVLLKIDDDLVKNGENFAKPEHELNETKEFTNSLIGLSQNFPFEENPSTENVTSTLCDDTTTDECKNFPKSTSQNTTDVLGWRFLTWVCINTALAFTGVTCTLSLMLFIIIRLFKGDVLESSLCFNLLLMLSVIFTYSSSILFHLEYLSDNRLLCLSRINAPPVICAILFSLLLSRSLMLAFNERNSEFGDHINGYLHFILCILMISLQGSITFQNWDLDHIDENCSQVHDQYRLIIALSYNFILLICLACVSPFIICSKRNNKEGLLISICVFFITVVWSTWISFYILFANEYKDAAVAVGLNATATVIVLCIFIPRTYFMTVPGIRDSALCYIPTLGKLTDGLAGQSSQTLHDSVGGISYKNCELGTSNPNFFTSRSGEGDGGGFVRESAVDLSSDISQAK